MAEEEGGHIPRFPRVPRSDEDDTDEARSEISEEDGIVIDPPSFQQFMEEDDTNTDEPINEDYGLEFAVSPRRENEIMTDPQLQQFMSVYINGGPPNRHYGPPIPEEKLLQFLSQFESQYMAKFMLDDDSDEPINEHCGPEIMEENTPKGTARLAIMNLDWSCVSANDLLLLLDPYVPLDGLVLSVAVYPSECREKKDERRYYAVAECDSSSTADYLYTSCDGIGFEIEGSSNKLELHFIPDSMEFNLSPRDVAKESALRYDCGGVFLEDPSGATYATRHAITSEAKRRSEGRV